MSNIPQLPKEVMKAVQECETQIALLNLKKQSLIEGAMKALGIELEEGSYRIDAEGILQKTETEYQTQGAN